jgi:hypothetical protein
MNYRKLWESYYGKIPYDNEGRVFDVHHLDGNRNNNDINNLICISLEDHYKIHLEQYYKTNNQKDLASAIILAGRLNKKTNFSGWTHSEETKNKIKITLTGKKRPKEVVDKFSEKLKGYIWTEEQIESRINGLKKFYLENSKESRKEWRDNISKSHKGKKLKDITKEKLSRYNSKLSDEIVLKIMDLILSGERYKIISEKYNISKSQITSIKQKKTYKWLWN